LPKQESREKIFKYREFFRNNREITERRQASDKLRPSQFANAGRFFGAALFGSALSSEADIGSERYYVA
jgi:hypothetical protein